MKRQHSKKDHSEPNREQKKTAIAAASDKESSLLSNLLPLSKDLSSKNYDERNRVLIAYQNAMATESAVTAFQLLKIVSEKLSDILATNEDCMYMARYICVSFDRCLKKSNTFE